jgi:hypothetical protein
MQAFLSRCSITTQRTIMLLVLAIVASLGLVAGVGTTATAAPSSSIVSTTTDITPVAAPAAFRVHTDRATALQRPHVATGSPAVGRVAPLVAAAVWLIIRFGYYAVRYSPQVLTAFNNWLMKREACRELRRQGNGWGWSWLCAGT